MASLIGPNNSMIPACLPLFCALPKIGEIPLACHLLRDVPEQGDFVPEVTNFMSPNDTANITIEELERRLQVRARKPLGHRHLEVILKKSGLISRDWDRCALLAIGTRWKDEQGDECCPTLVRAPYDGGNWVLTLVKVKSGFGGHGDRVDKVITMK